MRASLVVLMSFAWSCGGPARIVDTGTDAGLPVTDAGQEEDTGFVDTGFVDAVRSLHFGVVATVTAPVFVGFVTLP